MGQIYTVEVIVNRKTGLMVATSADLPGLYVHGRNDDELEERIPTAIEALLKAQGEGDIEIEKIDGPDEPDAFRSNTIRYQRELVAVA